MATFALISADVASTSQHPSANSMVSKEQQLLFATTFLRCSLHDAQPRCIAASMICAAAYLPTYTQIMRSLVALHSFHDVHMCRLFTPPHS